MHRAVKIDGARIRSSKEAPLLLLRALVFFQEHVLSAHAHRVFPSVELVVVGTAETHHTPTQGQTNQIYGVTALLISANVFM